jgi:preprotein translocase subunit Sec61beta
LKPTDEDVKRRLDSHLRRERLKTPLLIVGIGCCVAGVFAAINPFGPAVSNLNNIPKADPNAGMGLIQELPLSPARVVGIVLVVVGVVVLIAARLCGSQDIGGGNVHAET